MPIKAGFVLMLSIMVLGLTTGCAFNPWQGGYRPAPTQMSQAHEMRTHTAVRQIPWPRLEQFLNTEADLLTQSDVAVEDWTPQQQAEARDRMMRALKLAEKPGELEVIGTSTFQTDRKIDPKDGQLAEFARKIGADYVVYSTRYLGKQDTIRMVPTWTHTSGRVYRESRRNRSSRRRHRVEYYDETTLSSNPVRVRADFYGFVAYFVKRLDESEQ